MKIKFFNKNEMNQLLFHLKEHRSKHDSYMFFDLMLRTGCRTDEFMRIRVCDLVKIPNGYEVSIRKGSKGSKPRLFKLDSFRTEHLCEAILARCNAFKFGDTKPLIHLLSDAKIPSAKRTLQRHWDTLMFELFGAAGYKYTLHSLRHTFAKQVYEKSGKDIVAVQKGLGHVSLQSTSFYLSHLEFDQDLYKNAI